MTYLESRRALEMAAIKSIDERYDLIMGGIRRLNKALNEVFSGKSLEETLMFSLDMTRALASEVLKCDGSLNEKEISFLNGFLQKHGFAVDAREFCNLSASEGKKEIDALVLAAAQNLSKSPKLEDECNSMLTALRVLFIVFATADDVISEEECKLLSEDF